MGLFDRRVRPRPSTDRRDGSPRAAIGRLSTLRMEDQAPRDVLVEDLSTAGFRFSARDMLPIGAAVRIGLAGAGVGDARIVREAGGGYACAFVEPLTPEQRDAAFTAVPVIALPFEPAPAPGPSRRVTPGGLAAVLGFSLAGWALVLGVLDAVR